MKQISEHAAAAKAIRTELKKHGIKAKVRADSYSMGSSVNIYLNDIPPHILEPIKTFCNQYQYGHFNGMEDIYEMSNNNQDLPQVKFVFVNNKYSNETYQEAWTELRNRLQGMDQYDEDYERACCSYEPQHETYKYLTGYQADFMFSKFLKPRIAA